MRKILFLVIGLLLVLDLRAQVNSKQINVNQMTDAQVEQYMKRAELMGYSESQIRAFAQAQGISQSEIQKLEDRVKQIKSNKSH